MTATLLEMKDNGYPVQTAAEGYDLKLEEVQLKLHPLGLPDLPVCFFNAAEDAPELLRSFVRERIEIVREVHRRTLREIIDGARALLLNYEKAQAEKVMQAASRSLKTWLDHNTELAAGSTRRVHDSLVSATQSAHWRTIYASVVRRGEWQNLDYAHQLSHGARRIATQIAEPKVNGFKEIATNLLNDSQYEDAHDLVRQTIRVLEESFDNLVRKVQLVGESVHSDDLSADDEFWSTCSRISGRGYRDRINSQNRQWFEDQHDGDADARVMGIIAENWSSAIASVRELLTQ